MKECSLNLGLIFGTKLEDFHFLITIMDQIRRFKKNVSEIYILFISLLLVTQRVNTFTFAVSPPNMIIQYPQVIRRAWIWNAGWRPNTSIEVGLVPLHLSWRKCVRRFCRTRFHIKQTFAEKEETHLLVKWILIYCTFCGTVLF